MVNEVKQELKKKMEDAISAMKQSLSRIRTGKASVSLLDGIMVDYYGTQTPINQLATLSTPEPRLIAVQPWDKGALASIEKAILKSELGLNPNNDGKIIRIPIPPLTEERRKELVKMVKKTAEEFRVEIRNHRREANTMLKDMEKEKEITKDDLKKALDDVQELTNKYMKKIDEVSEEKEKEIMEI
ncbi:MAG: ribosome recycling factor [Deltaproteobacteria bacterium]|nr:MAG: ribosome recycling factor [Deltaproteobacteria bacterium]